MLKIIAKSIQDALLNSRILQWTVFCVCSFKWRYPTVKSVLLHPNILWGFLSWWVASHPDQKAKSHSKYLFLSHFQKATNLHNNGVHSNSHNDLLFSLPLLLLYRFPGTPQPPNWSWLRSTPSANSSKGRRCGFLVVILISI